MSNPAVDGEVSAAMPDVPADQATDLEQLRLQMVSAFDAAHAYLGVLCASLRLNANNTARLNEAA